MSNINYNFIDNFICPECNTRLKPYVSSDDRVPNDPNQESSCQCGCVMAMKNSDYPSVQSMAITFHGPQPWSIMLSQKIQDDGSFSFIFRAAPVLISGSNIVNIFVFNYKTIDWTIKLGTIPDFMMDYNHSPEFLIRRLDTLLTFA